jgi:lipoprotein-releasing system permease protein
VRRFNFNWISFVAGRYVSRGRRNSPSPLLAILGIATGVLALIVILAVMNGFQMGFIESILEISSYHLRLESFPPKDMAELRNRAEAIPEIQAVVPFREFQGLIRAGKEGQQAALIRGLPPDAPEIDAAMGSKLVFEAGAFDIADEHSILLGAELARRLSVRPGDELVLFSITDLFSGGPAASEPASGSEEPEAGALTDTFRVTGIFRTGFYEYDLSWGFVNIAAAEKISGAALTLGLKLKNRWQDGRVMELTRKALAGAPGADALKLTSWRDYNRAFFSALRTEKLFMFLLVGLIFIVVGLNIFQAQRRAVLERREEIGLLRAVGASSAAVRLVFVWDGAIIGFAGSAAGLCLGLLIAANIPVFFTLLERLVNFFVGAANLVLGGAAGEFAIFSPTVFYIKEIPSRLIPQEVFFICMFGFLSALLAAWFASGKAARTGPAEVLRDD